MTNSIKILKAVHIKKNFFKKEEPWFTSESSGLSLLIKFELQHETVHWYLCSRGFTYLKIFFTFIFSFTRLLLKINITLFFLIMKSESESEIEVMSDSLRPPWTVAYQVSQSMGFSRQEYWVGCHFLFQGIFSTQGSNPRLPHCRRRLYPLSDQIAH